MLTMRFLIAAALFGAVMYGDDITLPLDNGNVLIRAQFIRVGCVYFRTTVNTRQINGLAQINALWQ
jgi:hypothetical protein